MYNKYMPAENDAFSELYKPIEPEYEKICAKEELQEKRPERKFDLKRFLHGIDVGKMGIVPLVLLLLLLYDADDEEKLIIIALAFIFGV